MVEPGHFVPFREVDLPHEVGREEAREKGAGCTPAL